MLMKIMIMINLIGELSFGTHVWKVHNMLLVTACVLAIVPGAVRKMP